MRQATYAKCARTPSSATTATQKITRARMGWLVSSDARADISFRHQSTSHCSRWDRSPHWYSDRANTSRTARRTESGGTPCTPTRSDMVTAASAVGAAAQARRPGALGSPGAEVLAQELQIEGFPAYPEVVVHQREHAGQHGREDHGQDGSDHQQDRRRRGG